MKRVVTVNLGGKACQLEEDGLAILTEYLEDADARLRGNPDVAEILLDLELAIADKAELCLNARKNVVTAREIERIVEEMGPVDIEDYVKSGEKQSAYAGDRDDVDTAGAASQAQKPKSRLYKLTGRNEKMLAGVCAGLAARSGIDVSLVRIAFVVLTLATSGLGAIGYLALALLMPSADVPHEAGGSGGAPFNMREAIDAVHAKLHGIGAARRSSSRERHRHRGAYAYAGHDGYARRRCGIGGFLRFGALLAALMIGVYVLDQIRNPWFLPSFYASGGAAPELPVLALVLVAGILLWVLIGARRRTTRSRSGGGFVAFSAKLVVVLAVAWFVLQLGGTHFILHDTVSSGWNW